MINNENERFKLEEQVREIDQSFTLPKNKAEDLAEVTEAVEGTGLVIENVKLEINNTLAYINEVKDLKLSKEDTEKTFKLNSEFIELQQQYLELKTANETNERKYSPILMQILSIK